MCAIIKPKKSEEEDEFRLQYIRGGIMKTPEISVLQAQKEIAVFGERMQHLFGLVRDLYATQDKEEFEKLFERIRKGEDVSDKMENEIGKYLGDIGSAHLSDDTKQKIRAMMREIGELESIGDSCFNLARIMHRKLENKVWFDDNTNDGILVMYSIVDEALTRMNQTLSGRREDYTIDESRSIEQRINAQRNAMKQKNIANLDSQAYSYELGTVLGDLISECEKAGDYVINVVEARLASN